MNLSSISIISIVTFLFIQGCRQNAQPIIHSPHDDGVKTFQEFADSTKQFPFSANIERRTIILHNYSKLTQGKSKKEVIELLGAPDYAIEGYAKESNRYIGSGWRYYFHLDRIENPNEKLDTLVNIYFDSIGKIKWVAPANIQELNSLGEPGAS